MDAISKSALVDTRITASRGFAAWLEAQRASLAFTSYQTGQFFMVGVLPNGSISFNQQNFTRAMGLCLDGPRLWLGSLFQLWRLENMLRPGELANVSFDACFVPREARITGDLDIHEVGVLADGHPVFVSTKYSCLATIDPVHSFRPIWRPPFISKLAAEDRCHLNGLAMTDGVPAYVTAVSRSDALSGWRKRRESGGVIVEVSTGQVVTDRLSMPHSPRLVGGELFALDSGRGFIVRVDPKSGSIEDIAFCPGFLRGMSVHNGFAIVTTSEPRESNFQGLPLQAEIEKRDSETWCGLFIVNLQHGDIVEWIRLEGAISELFDVVAIPGPRCPMSLGVGTIEIQQSISFEV